MICPLLIPQSLPQFRVKALMSSYLHLCNKFPNGPLQATFHRVTKKI